MLINQQGKGVKIVRTGKLTIPDTIRFSLQIVASVTIGTKHTLSTSGTTVALVTRRTFNTIGAISTMHTFNASPALDTISASCAIITNLAIETCDAILAILTTRTSCRTLTTGTILINLFTTRS